MTAQTNPKETTSINEIFEAQKKNQYTVARSTSKERKTKLKKLKNAIENTFRQALRDAMWADFHKPPQDVDLTEIFVATSEINHAIHHLSQWMRDQKVPTPLTLLGSSSYIKYEPKGLCLIISPWNFPLNLCMAPLVSAIAAGNTVIIKPSETTPNTSGVIKKLIESVFEKNEVAVVEGAVEASTKLLELPFNHIFFTGSPTVGKIVMAAAAKNLASVTLELGGKSPTIIDETADIKTAAKRIAWGKFMNAGQICIAPDYVFVQEDIKDKFIIETEKAIKIFYGKNASKSNDYTHIVNASHAKRLVNVLEDAKTKGAKILLGGNYDESKNFMEPTVVENASEDSLLLQNEIFGPILPIKTYLQKEEVVNYINQGEKPLALYVYSSKQKNIDYFLDNTRAGGSCINANDVHFFNNNLPFGGANNSGLGKSHGHFGFLEFSNARGVYRQHVPGALELLMPPYNNLKTKLIELTVKYF
jgi:aldehyde dehydrogenase (NAD+)